MCLLLEDVHFLSGKSGTQEELSNTLESLMNANKKIIYSSCYLPSDIPKAK
jgi:chromosomal replication initiator protein